MVPHRAASCLGHAWVDLFAWLRERREAGVFVVAFMSLVVGSVIVAFHTVWSGNPLVLTLLGWAQVLKALLYFSFPKYGLRKLQIPSHERAGVFVLAGAALLPVAAPIGYHLWRTA